jgi:hypothetical protein
LFFIEHCDDKKKFDFETKRFLITIVSILLIKVMLMQCATQQVMNRITVAWYIKIKILSPEVSRAKQKVLNV